MALADECVAKALEIGVENFQTARIVGAEAVLAANHVERRPLLRTRLGDEQRTLWEVERRESDLPDGFRAARSPAEPPGDHQMKNEKEIILEREDDPLAKAAQLDNQAGGRLIKTHTISGAQYIDLAGNVVLAKQALGLITIIT